MNHHWRSRSRPPTKPQAEDAERRQLTVMFCDLVGSTALASRLDPEDLREVLGAYHAAVAEVVTGFGGYVAKYMGDGVLAYFGYPQAHEHDAEQAVRAGLALVERVGRLESGAGALGEPGRHRHRPRRCRRSDRLGRLAGARGCRRDAEPCRAPAGNGAGRTRCWSRKARGGWLAICSTTAISGPSHVKGLAEPVPAWQVLRESTVENRFEALRSATLSPLIGRDEEVELLLRRWARAKDGEGQIVLISGEAGIGKSRIAAALQEQLERGAPYSVALFLLAASSRQRALSVHCPARTRRRISAARMPPRRSSTSSSHCCRASGDSTPETVAVSPISLGLPTEGRYPPPPTDPRQRRELIFGALVRQLEGLARHRPVLFLFEDAHWVDSTSLELLERVAERVRRLPVLMIVTYRPDSSRRGPARRR